MRLRKSFLYVMEGFYGWFLVLKTPWTLWEVVKVYRPGGFGIKNSEFWAFSRVDAKFRAWYNKIARDYKSQGRFGFAWDNGLGIALGTRIFNNWGTYKLLELFGTRNLMALGYLLMIATSVIICRVSFNPIIGLVVGILAASSPLIIGAYTHVGKPEAFWWGIALLFVYTVFSGWSFAAGLIWSLIAWVNLPVSALLAILLGPSLLISTVQNDTLIWIALGVSPGVIKLSLRGFSMWRSGFLTGLVSEQSRLWKRPIHPTANDLIWWVPFAFSIIASALLSGEIIVGTLILASCICVYWANFRVLYINDSQSFNLAFWTIGLGFAAFSQSILGVLFILMMAYNRPGSCGIPISSGSVIREDSFPQAIENIFQRLIDYPGFNPTGLPLPQALMVFFGNIPDGARIILESDGDPRTVSKFRAFREWTEEFLPQRKIDLVNEIYTRAVEPVLSDGFLTRFNATNMHGLEMKQLCDGLGVSFVVAFAEETIKSLAQSGFQELASVDLEQLAEFRDFVSTPPVTLTLLKNSSNVTVIHPMTDWECRGNTLTWEGQSDETYLILYRFHSEFHAFQSGEEIEVCKARPVGDLPVDFMQVKSNSDELITLRFVPHVI